MLRQTGKSWSINPADMDITKCKQKLWNSVSELLEIAGYPVEDLAKEFGVKNLQKTKIKKSKSNDGHNNAEPPRGVTG